MDSKAPGEAEMSMFEDPFDARSLLGRCACGGDHDEAGQPLPEAPHGEEARWTRVVDGAVPRAFFPAAAPRRPFLRPVGAPTALTAVSSVLPIKAAREAF